MKYIHKCSDSVAVFAVQNVNNIKTKQQVIKWADTLAVMKQVGAFRVYS